MKMIKCFWLEMIKIDLFAALAGFIFENVSSNKNIKPNDEINWQAKYFKINFFLERHL